jgi:hypothetical protein
VTLDAPSALGRLDVLAGRWTQEVDVSGGPRGTTTSTWILGDPYLLEESVLGDPHFPESRSIIEYDESTGGFRQHYFDSRGVTRVYRLELDGTRWTRTRTEPDFTALAFAQRFVGEISPDGRSVEGRWEQSHDGGATWELDFGLRYVRQP